MEKRIRTSLSYLTDAVLAELAPLSGPPPPPWTLLPIPLPWKEDLQHQNETSNRLNTVVDIVIINNIVYCVCYHSSRFICTLSLILFHFLHSLNQNSWLENDEDNFPKS